MLITNIRFRKSMAWLPVTLVFLLSVISLSFGTKVTDVIVETTYGRIRGTTDGFTKSFKSIPYAAPPLGLLRWQQPQPPSSWHPNVLDATDDSPGCPQINCNRLTPPIACPTQTSENCLFLNIFAPSNGTGLPVMVYIHGGNFFYMAGSSPLYNGEVFVQKGNVVLVNVDYRLGALGFLVTGTGELDARGNFGLYDQILALKWVQANIAQFGGDPNKVTLFGQSAGAQSVIQLMTSDESSGYFRNVIVESSPVTLPYKSYDEAYILGGLLAKELGCPVANLTCMRAKSANDVAQAAFNTRAQIASVKFLELFEPYGPYVDGNFVKGQPLDVFSLSQYTKKPLIIGTTTEETVLYVYGAYNKSMSIEEYVAILTAVRPDKILEILLQYPPSPTVSDQRETLVTMGTDFVFGCSTRNITRTMLTQGASDIWMYKWNHAFSFPGWGPITFCEGRVCHGSEIVYVFGTAYEGNFTFTAEEKTLSDDVISYWTNFAWTSDPNQSGEKFARMDQRLFGKEQSRGVYQMKVKDAQKRMAALAHWPQYDPNTGWPAFYFETPTSKVVQDYRATECQFWDRVGYS